MTTLTDRYIAATLRSVPGKSRGDIERELRASIGDAVDARMSKGETHDAAESAVLTELGDPSRLAAEYSGPPRYLIGPNVYQAYVRTLGVALAIFVPGAWLLILAAWVAGGASVPNALLTACVGALLAGLLVAFWTTVGYAVVDGSEEARREVAAAFGVKAGAWTPDRLPTSTSLRPFRASDAVEAIVGGTMGIAFIFVQRSVSPFSDASGHAIPFLNPDLWSFWIPIALVIAAAWVGAEFIMLARGTWSPRIALAITIFAIASGTIYICLLATGQLFNAAFFEKFGAARWVAPGSALVLLMMLLTVIDDCTRIAKVWGVPVGKGPRRR
jgi:hypothetical protein